MHTLNLASKTDVHNCRDKLKNICDKYGVRLGKSNEKAEAIIAELFGCADYNTLLGVVNKPSKPTDKLVKNTLRMALPRTTYGAKDQLIRIIRERVCQCGDKANRIIVFFHKQERVKFPIIGLLVQFGLGDDLIFIDHTMSLCNSKAETEILSLFKHLSTLVSLNAWYFGAKQITEVLATKSVNSIVEQLQDSPLKMFSTSWRDIFALSSKSSDPPKQDGFKIEEWQAIFSINEQ